MIDEPMLKAIYKKISIDFATDFEARIRKLAEIIRNSPTNDIDEFIRHLGLEEWAKELKESVEYFKVSPASIHPTPAHKEAMSSMCFLLLFLLFFLSFFSTGIENGTIFDQ